MQQKTWTKDDRIRALLSRVGLGATIASPNGRIRVAYDAEQAEEAKEANKKAKKADKNAKPVLNREGMPAGGFVFTHVQPRNGDQVRAGVSYDKARSNMNHFKAEDINGYSVISGSRLVKRGQEDKPEEQPDDGLETVTPEEHADRQDKKDEQIRERINMPETTTKNETTTAASEKRATKRQEKIDARVAVVREAIKGMKPKVEGVISDPDELAEVFGEKYKNFPKVNASDKVPADHKFKAERFDVGKDGFQVQTRAQRDGTITIVPMFEGKALVAGGDGRVLVRRVFANIMRKNTLADRGLGMELVGDGDLVVLTPVEAVEDAASADQAPAEDTTPDTNGEAA